jgi:hypothetical protein
MMNREEFRRLAEEIDALKDSGHELDGFTRVDVTIAEDLKAVVVLEMPHELLARISVAARAAGEEVNDFMQRAAIARMSELKRNRKPPKKASA